MERANSLNTGPIATTRQQQRVARMSCQQGPPLELRPLILGAPETHQIDECPIARCMRRGGCFSLWRPGPDGSAVQSTDRGGSANPNPDFFQFIEWNERTP